MAPRYDWNRNAPADSDEEPTLDPTPFIDVDMDDDDSVPATPDAFVTRQPTPPPPSEPDSSTSAHDELLCDEEMPESHDVLLYKRFHEHFDEVKRKYFNLIRVTGEYGNEHHVATIAQQYFDLIHNTATHLNYTKITFEKKDNPYIPTIWYIENQVGIVTTCHECLELMGIQIEKNFDGNRINIFTKYHSVSCVDMPIRPMSLDEALFTDCPEKCLVTNTGTLFKEGSYFPLLRACKRLLAHHVAFAYYGQGAPSWDMKCSCQICKHFDENSVETAPLYTPMVIDGECEMQAVAMMIVDEEEREDIRRCRDDCQYSPFNL